MTQTYPTSGNLSGRWTLPEVVFNIRNSGWIQYDNLEASNVQRGCNRSNCDPTVGPVIIDAYDDTSVCLPTGIIQGIGFEHPSGDQPPSPQSGTLPRTAQSFFRAYPKQKDASGLPRYPNFPASCKTIGSLLATKPVTIWKPNAKYQCGTGVLGSVTNPVFDFPLPECFMYGGSGSPLAKFTPSGWHVHGLDSVEVVYRQGGSKGITTGIETDLLNKGLYTPSATGTLLLAHSGEIQFRWRRLYEDWTLKETQILFSGDVVFPGEDCTYYGPSGLNATPEVGISGFQFWQKMLGGATTTDAMRYTTRPNFMDGSVIEHWYQGVLPMDHPAWNYITIDQGWKDHQAVKGCKWGLKLTHAWSSGQWFEDNAGFATYNLPPDTDLVFNSYTDLHCNDVNSVNRSPLFHQGSDFAASYARGNENIKYENNTNCHNYAADGTNLYQSSSSSGTVTIRGGVFNLYRELQVITPFKWCPDGASCFADKIEEGATHNTPGSGVQPVIRSSGYFYTSHVDPSVQFDTGGKYHDYDFCYKLGGRCHIDDVIEVGSCGICAGLAHTIYCPCPSGDCEQVMYGISGDEEISDSGVLRAYSNYNVGKKNDQKYTIGGRSDDTRFGATSADFARIDDSASVTVQWQGFYGVVGGSGDHVQYLARTNSTAVTNLCDDSDECYDPLKSFSSVTSGGYSSGDPTQNCIGTQASCQAYSAIVPGNETIRWVPNTGINYKGVHSKNPNDSTGSSKWCASTTVYTTGSPSLNGNNSQSGTIRWYDVLPPPASGDNCHWKINTLYANRTICTSYCEDVHCAGNNVTLHHPYEVSLEPNIIRGASTYPSGPQACAKTRQDLGKDLPVGSEYDVRWFSGPGEHPHSNHPYGPFMYKTSSCDAAIAKARQYDASNQRRRLTDQTVNHADERWENHPAHYHATINPTPRDEGRGGGDIFIGDGEKGRIDGKAWYQWWPYKLGLDARDYGADNASDAVSGMPPENICDLLDEIHDTPSGDGCTKMQAAYGSGIPGSGTGGVIWEPNTYEAMGCDGALPWFGAFDAHCTKCPPLTCMCKEYRMPVEFGVNFNVNCRAPASLNFNTCGSCDLSAFNITPLSGVANYPVSGLGRSLWGVPIDIDSPCDEAEDARGYPGKGPFTLYYQAGRYGDRAVPVISGYWFDTTTGYSSSHLFPITSHDSAEDLRNWTCNNLRFATKISGSGATAELKFNWPYNDLYWSYCTGEPIPINLIPC